MRFVVNSTLHESVTDADRNQMIKVWELMNKIGKIHLRVPHNHTFQINCHSLSRVIAAHLSSLKVVTGYFLGLDPLSQHGEKRVKIRNCEHSWLVTPDGAIIDPYPVGVIALCPLLIPTRGEYRVFAASQYYHDSETHLPINRKAYREVQVMSRLLLD